MAAFCLDSKDQGSSTTTAKGLSHGLHHQGHSLRHRRRRGSAPAPAGESATAAPWLYGAEATAYSFPGVPLLPAQLLHGTSLSRGRWYRSAASAGVRPRTPFFSCCPRWLTLRRLLRGSGLAGGFRRAVKLLALGFHGLCLPEWTEHASSGVRAMARLVDASRHCGG